MEGNKIKTVIIQELFSNYRGPVFDSFAEETELTVLHGTRDSSLKLIESDRSRLVRSRYLLGGRFVFLKVKKELSTIRPDVVVHQGSPGIVSLPTTWLWCKLNRVGFVIWTHGYERHQGFKPYRSFRSFLRLTYFKMADAVLFYTKDRRDFFAKYLTSQKIFYATNTLDTKTLFAVKKTLISEGRSSIKSKYGMTDSFNLVFIGRLLQEKRVDHLLIVLSKLIERGVKAKAHIIGNGEELENLKRQADQLDILESVVFYGAVYDDATAGQILYGADVMVIPGYVGLAINHAFCFDLPIVTYAQGASGPYHSPEISYLEDGKDGFLAESYSSEDMTDKLHQLAVDAELLALFRKNASEKAGVLTVEKMREGFMMCVNFASRKYQ